MTYLHEMQAEFTTAEKTLPELIQARVAAERAFIAAQVAEQNGINREVAARAAFARALGDRALIVGDTVYLAHHVGTGGNIESKDYRVKRIQLIVPESEVAA